MPRLLKFQGRVQSFTGGILLSLAFWLVLARWQDIAGWLLPLLYLLLILRATIEVVTQITVVFVIWNFLAHRWVLLIFIGCFLYVASWLAGRRYLQKVYLWDTIWCSVENAVLFIWNWLITTAYWFIWHYKWLKVIWVTLHQIFINQRPLVRVRRVYLRANHLNADFFAILIASLVHYLVRNADIVHVALEVILLTKLGVLYLNILQAVLQFLVPLTDINELLLGQAWYLCIRSKSLENENGLVTHQCVHMVKAATDIQCR